MKGMDLGLACHKQTSQPNASFLGSNENEPRGEMGHGSGHLKHQRSELAEDNSNNNNIWRLSKMPRPGDVDFSSKKDGESLFSNPFERSILWSPVDDGDGQKMLSFSSVDPHSGGGSSKSMGFSIYPDEHHSKAGGLGLNQGSKGPLTPSQWMELEHQTLIYKHIEANLPVPSSLLAPLNRSLYSYDTPLLGWGPLHLGFSGSNDPEPGRCRRTDGKKWRCSRDAVPDQKYCERHINRGRHRSRKPVEGRTGHTLSGPTNASKALVVPSSSAAVNASSGLRAMQPPISASASTDYLVTRSQEFQGLSLIPPTAPLKPKEVPFSVQQNCFTLQEPLNLEFGVVSANSIPNPSGRISYLKTTATDASVHHFMGWPKDQSHHTTSGPWDEPLKPDWTQLSMSIPDFTCSPTRAKPGPFLGPPQELDPIVHMGLGLGGKISGPVQKVHQPAWQPIAWGNPLGEVLSSQVCGTSPTGVLQKQTFISGSNSSSGSGSSSLRSGGEDKKGSTNNGSLGDDAFGSAFLTSEAVPSQ